MKTYQVETRGHSSHSWHTANVVRTIKEAMAYVHKMGVQSSFNTYRILEWDDGKSRVYYTEE